MIRIKDESRPQSCKKACSQETLILKWWSERVQPNMQILR